MRRSERLKNILRSANDRGYHIDEHGRPWGPRGSLCAYERGTKTTKYPTISIRLTPQKVVQVQVHQLAGFQRFGDNMFAPDVELRHCDGNRLNTRPDNLLLGNRADNERDKPSEIRRRFTMAGARAQRRLTEEQAQNLRDDRVRGANYIQLCRKYKLAKSTVSYIINRKTYCS